LGEREDVLRHAEQALKDEHNVIIDRSNVNAQQREPWVTLARSMPNVEVQAFFFNSPLKVRAIVRL
jgi:predicted kinase